MIANEIGADAILWDGLDDAIIGIATRANLQVVAYDHQKVADILCETMNVDDVVEWIDFNINGAYVGERTPVLVRRMGTTDGK